VDVSYGGENGFNQAIEMAAESLQNVKFVQEKKLLSSFMEEIARDTGKISIGLKETLYALEAGAVETLILWENLEYTRYVLKNPQTQEQKKIYLTPNQRKDRSYFTENGVELEVVTKDPLLEYFAEHYKEYGTALAFVTDRSQLGSQFVKGFGGVGGLLRYKFDSQVMLEADAGVFENVDSDEDSFDESESDSEEQHESEDEEEDDGFDFGLWLYDAKERHSNKAFFAASASRGARVNKDDYYNKNQKMKKMMMKSDNNNRNDFLRPTARVLVCGEAKNDLQKAF